MKNHDIIDHIGNLTLTSAIRPRESDRALVAMTRVDHRDGPIRFGASTGTSNHYPSHEAKADWLTHCFRKRIRSGTGNPITTLNALRELIRRTNDARIIIGLPPLTEDDIRAAEDDIKATSLLEVPAGMPLDVALSHNEATYYYLRGLTPAREKWPAGWFPGQALFCVNGDPWIAKYIRETRKG